MNGLHHNCWLKFFAFAAVNAGTAFIGHQGASSMFNIISIVLTIIAFDPQSQKLCMVDGAKDPGEVLDFSYIRKWQLKWTEKSGNGNLSFLNVHFDFSTNDLKRPLIRIPVAGKAYGDTWNSRLGILLQA